MVATDSAAIETSAPEVAAAPTGDPSILGLPSFVVGAVALSLATVGYVPPAAVGAALPIILGATGLGLLITTVWCAYLGQSFVACVFGVFTGFWFSYAALVLGCSTTGSRSRRRMSPGRLRCSSSRGRL